MPYVPCPACLTVRSYREPYCRVCRVSVPYEGERSRSGSPRRWSVPALVLLSALSILPGCGGGGGGDPQRRARYDADDARCRRMADSMAASARAAGKDEDAGDYDGVRKSCMTYRGWVDGKFQ